MNRKQMSGCHGAGERKEHLCTKESREGLWVDGSVLYFDRNMIIGYLWQKSQN